MNYYESKLPGHTPGLGHIPLVPPALEPLCVVAQTEVSSLRDTVNELEAGKASLQQDVQRYQRLYVQEVDVSNDLRRQLHTARQTATTSTLRSTAQPTATR